MGRSSYCDGVTTASPLPLARSTRFAALAVTLLLLVSCTPEPAPTPTPTPAFASEEEAFAAAEATYREFTARLNEVDTTDPETFEPLFDLSSGEFEKADRAAYSAMHANQVSVQGETKIISFAGKASTPPFTSIQANVCLDVSAVSVEDSEGNSRVDDDRPDVYALAITFVTEEGYLTIDSAKLDPEVTC